MLHTHSIFNRIYPASVVLFFVFTISIIFPFSGITDNADATITQSTTTLTLSNANVDLDLTVDNLTDAFAASTPADFTVTTNNYTGYTLSILAATSDANATKLVNTKNSEHVFNSISSASTESEFNVGNWGYLPSKLNSAVNTKYQPAPTSAGTTLDVTSAANSTANNYSITLGAKAGSSTPAGSYTNSFTLSAVANPVTYSITYNKNTTDTVSNMPSTQSGTIGSTDIKLSSSTPTRDHYTFQGWCTTTPTTSNGVDSCSGTTYQPGATYNTNKTTANTLALKAMWKIDSFVQTTRVRYEVANKDGTYGSYTTVDTKTVNYGSSYSWSSTSLSGFDTDTYNSASVASYTVKEANTNSVNITRKSYKLTVSRDSNYITSVTGTDTYKVGKVVGITATAGANYKFTKWTQTAGTTSSFGSATSASTTFTMPASAATVKANGKIYYIQGVTTSLCPTAATIVYDNRDNTAYHVQKLADGKCWMLDNLALDITNSTVKSKLSASNTNASATTLNYLKNGGGTTSNKYAITGVANWTSDDNIYSVPLVNMASKNVVPNNAPTNGKGYNRVGGYYNYCAASAGSYCYGNGSNKGTSSGNATEDICPKNWRMPTSNTGEYGALANAIYGSTGNTSDATAIANYRNALSLPLSGDFFDGSVHYLDDHGHFWSSVRYNDDYMWYLGVSTGSVTTSIMSRQLGASVRCIASS